MPRTTWFAPEWRLLAECNLQITLYTTGIAPRQALVQECLIECECPGGWSLASLGGRLQ